MHFARHSLVSLLSVPVAFASPISSSSIIQRRQDQGPLTGKAAYVLTNNPKNAVAAILINADGTLGEASVTKTGGCGSASLNAMGQAAVPDSLISQSALTIAGQHIFAVNAGSNSISMLAISPTDPLKLERVGRPVALPGTFPNTIAASVKNSLVCVGTTGSKAGISCANFDPQSGIGPMDALRPFDLKQSDPPVGPLNTVSHTFFSEDQSMLFTTVKGNPMVNNTGFLSVFAVEGAAAPMNMNNGCVSGMGAGGAAGAAKLSMQETRSSPAGTAVLFGSQVIPGSNPPQIFTTDASFGAAILSVGPDMTSTLVANLTIPDQRATCWTTISTVSNTAFVTDVGINRILELSLKDASKVGEIDLSTQEASKGDPGLIDLRAAGAFVYALSPGNGTTEAAISVVDVRSKALVQHAKLGSIGVKSMAMGMAVLL